MDEGIDKSNPQCENGKEKERNLLQPTSNGTDEYNEKKDADNVLNEGQEKKKKVLQQHASQDAAVVSMTDKADNIKRNVLIIGGKSSGKSTVANFILQQRKFPTGRSLHGITDRITPDGDRRIIDRKVVDIVIYDTPGIPKGTEYNTDKLLDEIINVVECAEIDLIIAVFEMDRFFPSYIKFVNNFSAKVCIPNAVIITNCDGMTTEGKEEVVHNFKTSESTKCLSQKVKNVIVAGYNDDTLSYDDSVRVSIDDLLLKTQNSKYDRCVLIIEEPFNDQHFTIANQLFEMKTSSKNHANSYECIIHASQSVYNGCITLLSTTSIGDKLYFLNKQLMNGIYNLIIFIHYKPDSYEWLKQAEIIDPDKVLYLQANCDHGEINDTDDCKLMKFMHQNGKICDDSIKSKVHSFVIDSCERVMLQKENYNTWRSFFSKHCSIL